jgi:hypothetical protein
MSDMVLVPKEDRDNLDAIVKLLGIEDSHTTPAEAVQEIIEQAEEAHRIQRNIQRAMIEYPDVADLLAERPHGMTVCAMCGSWRRSPCGEGCTWGVIGNPRDGSVAAP